MWPRVVAAAMSLHSFQEALEMMRVLIPTLKDVLSDFCLENQVQGRAALTSKGLHIFPQPESLLFFPEMWSKINVEDLFWNEPKFLHFCGNSLSRSRICFLVWSLITIDPIVIDQLWSSLKPINSLFNDNGPHSLLEHLLNVENGISSLPDVMYWIDSSKEAPYEYGTQTGKVLSLNAPQQFKQSLKPIPISAFELALAAILYETPLQLFLTTDIPLLDTSTMGPVKILSPILDCTGTTEPFKSLTHAPLHQYNPANEDVENISPLEERHIFFRQALWLFDTYLHKGSNVTTPIIITVDSSNFVQSAYKQPIGGFVKPISFDVFLETSNDKWPKEIITTGHSNLISKPLPKKYFPHIKKLQNQNMSINDMFSQFPTELVSNHGNTSKSLKPEIESSHKNIPPSTDDSTKPLFRKEDTANIEFPPAYQTTIPSHHPNIKYNKISPSDTDNIDITLK